MIRLLIVDDQALVREGMASLLSLEEDVEIVGQAAHGEQACQMADELKPDVILMDIRMPVLDGVGATRKIRERQPDAKIVVLTTFDDDDYVLEALKAGASGYLLKDTPSEHVAAAIRSVYQGHTLLGASVTSKVLSHLSQRKPQGKTQDWKELLTLRELEVLKLIGQGKNNREIASMLNITEGTVKNHVTRVLTQLNVRDRTQAALWAQQNMACED
jgi:DNA-binding NarL/FixJ family response regulator